MAWDIRCSYCGQFIKGDDLDNGKATFYMLYPDSAFTRETWIGVCRKCKVPKEK